MKEQKEFTLDELAKFTDSKIVGNPDYIITGYADLESASEKDVSFLSKPRYTNTRYVNAMMASRAGAIFIAPSVTPPEGRNYLINKDPSKAFQKAIENMRGSPSVLTYFEGIHPSAVIHETAKIGKNVKIGPNSVIDAYTEIGDNTTLGSCVSIGPHTTIGTNCNIQSNAAIRENCHLGNNVTIQSGTVIGSWGFGYSTDEKGVHTRISQIGSVVIEDDVEIAANTTVDRARFTETRIGKGTKIDTMVVIGHNVKLGRHNLICGQTGIAGSTKTGNHVVVAGQCGIDGHLNISDGVMIAARSGVTKSLSKGKYGGFPAQPLEQFNKNNVLIRQLEKFADQIEKLQARLDELEKS